MKEGDQIERERSERKRQYTWERIDEYNPQHSRQYLRVVRRNRRGELDLGPGKNVSLGSTSAVCIHVEQYLLKQHRMTIHTTSHTTLSTRLDQAETQDMFICLATRVPNSTLHNPAAKEIVSSRALDICESIPCNVFGSGETCPTT